ncbi:hypothetical protein PMG11_08993 [Penicillium brasilianum]|uniref:Uncharacterized protein n=1 Tax=Penicillium brasilianum TaxID=104259 RepID=A0A0F7TUK8_PENBI|nr:hypothetical protein PMG11_08993 [Penicillium brasilianum]
MPNPPIDPQADRANEPDPSDTDMMGFTSFDELDSAILDGFDPANINQMFAEFTDSLNAEMANAIASANIQMPPQATHLVSSQQGLEAYMVQMQIYAGISLDQLQPMRASPQSQGGRRAPVIQIVNGRTMLAVIPPATFNGFLAPMLTHQIGPWNSENVEGGPGHNAQPESQYTGSNPNGSKTDESDNNGYNTDCSNSDDSDNDGSNSDGSNSDGAKPDGSDTDGPDNEGTGTCVYIRAEDSDIEIDMGESGNR